MRPLAAIAANYSSNYPLLLELRDLLVAVTQWFEIFGVVLAQFGRRQRMGIFGIAVCVRESHGAYIRLVLARYFDLQAHVFYLRVCKNLLHVVDRRVWHVVRFQLLHPMSARLFFEKVAENFSQLVVVLPAIRPGIEARIVDQFWMTGGLAQTFPEFLRRRKMNREHCSVGTRERVGL